ncbi:MAG: hypothetical protein ACFFAO_08515 [Candidatus Hermodarchaeota archaeon]
MDTTKSNKIVQEYLQKEPKFIRKVKKFSGTFDTTPEKIFPLLCPAREADWIIGWDSELLYTESGYAEDKCVFRTDENNLAGEGIWTFTGYKLNEYIKFVKIEQDLLIHAKVDVVQNENASTTVTWNITSTAISEKGNKLLENPKSHIDSNLAVKMLDYYLKNGKKISKMSLMKEKIHH